MAETTHHAINSAIDILTEELLRLRPDYRRRDTEIRGEVRDILLAALRRDAPTLWKAWKEDGAADRHGGEGVLST